MYGWRARIGAIVVSDDVTTECEYWRMAPEGVGVHAARMHVVDDLPPIERLSRMAPHARRAASDLATLRPNVAVYACTSGSFFQGREWSRDYMDELSELAGCAVVATADAVVEALEELGVRNVGVATPYSSEVNQRLRVFYEEAGFNVLSVVGADLDSNWDVCAMTERHIADLASAAAVRGAEAIFFACTAVPIVAQIERLERDLGLPVVTANQATFWAALKRCGIAMPPGWGRLFRGAGTPVSGARII
jgi:maleate cis-trans isomerase